MAQIRVMFLLLLYVLTVTTFFSDAKSIRNTEIQISSSMSELFRLKKSMPNVSERRKSKFEIEFFRTKRSGTGIRTLVFKSFLFVG